MNQSIFNSMKQHLPTTIGFVGIVFAIAMVSPAIAQTAGSIYYYDGSDKVYLQVEPGIVAEFAKPNQGQKNLSNSIIIKSDTSATMLKTYGNTTIWKSNAGGDSISYSKNLNQTSSSSFSPVLTTIKGSQLLALPGNILVELAPSFTASQADAFFAKRGLRSLQKLDIPGRNYYEVETPPGLASLEAANSLFGAEGVIASTPNFWREMVAK
ncbi:hypothetical protein [Leptospira sp. GIMC2001]|uniref:hypothetical protein n=1 Tax=Leptospira sp. GIMC2001 TaxID=1513297 RepID=UPI00234A4F74|nr:hypothetical protein [Leptospira sp. GIMC2001]WCL48756.1 hypothetical protein O4O04_15820 [Leptospira sp. GIMC2001]